MERRLTAAQRVRAKRAEEEKLIAAAIEEVETAYREQQEHLAAADAADDRVRAGVTKAMALRQSLEDIAELSDVPLPVVRGSRRPKASSGDDEHEESPAATARGRRQLAVDPSAGGTAVPAFLGDQDGASEEERRAADELTAMAQEMGTYDQPGPGAEALAV